MILSADLQSVQDVRAYLDEAKRAQQLLGSMSQEEIDRIVHQMANAARKEASRLASLAVEETGFGRLEDKMTKNLFAAEDVYESIKDMKTAGIINRDDEKKLWEVAQPVGIVAAIVPSTNPTSTTIFKALIAIKARNAIIFSPHPSAAGCTFETASILQEAAIQAGAPKGIISCLRQPTMLAVNELITHPLTNLILATGGLAMVKAAYSSGKPAYGVGPGNVPVYIHSSANISQSITKIIQSKTFDYGTICASEQAIVVDRSIRRKVLSELKKQGALLVEDYEKERVSSVIMKNGVLNAQIVGKSPQKIAELAGIVVPPQTTVIVAEENEVGKAFPFSVEKLSPILALYTVENQQEAEQKCQELLTFGGLGHTAGIHAENHHVIEEFSMKMPVSRVVVNTGTTFGGIGATTSIQPSLTLGCGAIGGNVTSDNIGPAHLINIKRVAFGIREMNTAQISNQVAEQLAQPTSSSISKADIAEIVKSILQEIQFNK